MERNRYEEFYTFYNQDFHNIRDWCLRRGYLFEDPHFKLDYKYEWRRPPELTRDPQLFIGGHARFDILQGELGDCWMLAAIAALGMHPDLVRKVIPSDQSFESQYAGIFHFRFWRFGKWYDVVIDDRLPTENGELVFTRSQSQNEFWSALLEKAYCKVIGGEYQAADAGNLCEALEDFTGGVVEQFLLRNAPRNFPNILVQSVARQSLVGCFIDNLPGTSQSQTSEGLVRGHSYSVTDAKSVNLPRHGNIVLVRVRNPWGKFEWTGPWSDSSSEWRSVPQSTRQELGLVYKDDGEFWMSCSDFVTRFEWVDMCHLGPEAFSNAYGNISDASSWQLNTIKGSWVRGVSAGGARDLHRNPQIRFSLSEADDNNNDGLCAVLIALFQKPSGREALDYYEIGFKVFQVQDPQYNQTTLDKYFLRNNRSIADVPTKGVREVAGRFNLPPGVYCVIPFTYETAREGEFLLRIYSEKRTFMEQLDYRIGISPVDITASETPPMKIGAEEEIKKDDRLREYFNKVSGRDKEIDWKELKDLLDDKVRDDLHPSREGGGGWSHILFDIAYYAYDIIFGSSSKPSAFKTIGRDGFSKDVCRSLVALIDVDHSGKLGFNEFQILWAEIKKWKSIYERYNENAGGYVNSSGLKDAIESSGFHLSQHILGGIVHRYTTKDGNISFDDFLHCCLKLKTMSEFFISNEDKDSHKAEFTLDQFMEKTLYS